MIAPWMTLVGAAVGNGYRQKQEKLEYDFYGESLKNHAYIVAVDGYRAVNPIPSPKVKCAYCGTNGRGDRCQQCGGPR